MEIDYRKLISNSWQFVTSEKYREGVARDYGKRRVEKWLERGQLQDTEAAHFTSKLEEESISPYIVDLMVHSGMKPLEMTALPAIALGLASDKSIDYATAGAIILWGGSITRTLYTLGRMGYETLKPANLQKMPDQIRDFIAELHSVTKEDGMRAGIGYIAKSLLGVDRAIALAVGWVPTVGNAAYPLQMVYSGATEDQDLGKFMLYDIFSAIGRKIPVWGGRDTLTEHFFNSVPDMIVRNRSPLRYSK